MAIGIALLGHGNVGREVRRVIAERYRDLVEIKKILVRDASNHQDISQEAIASSLNEILADEEIKIVVELIGGDTDARDYIVKALQAGKHVVTANKAVISQCGDEIISLANRQACQIRFEAAVGGGTPLIRAIEQVRHGQIRVIAGILNGTSNFILTEVEEFGSTFSEAIGRAQKAGFAEKDPTLDIDGTDTCQKISILATLAFGTLVKPDQVACQGIWAKDWEIIPTDMKYASDNGLSIKLIGLAKRSGSEVQVRVGPSLVPKKHFLAEVNGAYNGLWIVGIDIQHQFFYGVGAGPQPTAATVASGIYEIARSLNEDARVRKLEYGGTSSLLVRDPEQVVTRGFIRSLSPDKPGVFRQKLDILSNEKINVQSVKNYRERVPGTEVMPDYIEIDPTEESRVRAAIEKISVLETVKGRAVYFRIEDDLQMGDEKS